LLFIVWLLAVLGIIVATMNVVRAADMGDCKTYAARGSAAALKALLSFPFIDVASGKFLYRKAYTFCVNADEMPVMVFTPEEQPIVDGRVTPFPPMKPEGSVPATEAKLVPVDTDLAKAWEKCARSHPRGWDEATHTITKYIRKKWRRVSCP
jgi:hypothetical protein